MAGDRKTLSVTRRWVGVSRRRRETSHKTEFWEQPPVARCGRKRRLMLRPCVATVRTYGLLGFLCGWSLLGVGMAYGKLKPSGGRTTRTTLRAIPFPLAVCRWRRAWPAEGIGTGGSGSRRSVAGIANPKSTSRGSGGSIRAEPWAALRVSDFGLAHEKIVCTRLLGVDKAA